MEFIVDKEAKTVHITREFGAGRDLVWDAWTNPEILDQWWAPKPFASRTTEMDFRVGGRRLYAMVSPEGDERWSKQEYTAINPNYHFKFDSLFTDAEGNANTDFAASEWDVNFSGDDETTTVNVVISRDSFDEIEKMIEMGFKDGFTATLQSLEELLTSKS